MSIITLIKKMKIKEIKKKNKGKQKTNKTE